MLISLVLAGVVGVLGSRVAAAQDRVPEVLRESRIVAHAPARLKPRLGLPERLEGISLNLLNDIEFSEAIYLRDGVWVSLNPESGLPNWVCWEAAPYELGKRDKFLLFLPEGAFRGDPVLWEAIISECYDWALEKPEGGTTVVCGCMSFKRLGDCPEGFFCAVCKKSPGRLGWKSIAFMVPNGPSLFGRPYAYSLSVNMIEAKSGYNLFPRLPENLQELVEDMTTYELFSSFIEQEEYMDDEPDFDFYDGEMDYLDDMREAGM